MEQPKNNDYLFFNKFQTFFYTNIAEFQNFTYFEIKNNSFTLLNNLIKGFPHLAEELMNIYSPAVKIFESPAIILALQRKFVNNFSRPRVPQYLYYKSMKAKPESKKKSKDVKVNGVILKEFPMEVKKEIMSILMYDTKTYEYLKYSTKIQFLGNQLLGEFQRKEEIKRKKLFVN
jgi:hypothetical protein